MTRSTAMEKQHPWIIVGGGASGLAAAFFLRQRGLESVIVERDGVIGGRMATVQLGERSLDCGGKNIGRAYRLFREFAASLGTHRLEYFGLNSSQAIEGSVRTLEARSRWRSMASLVRGVAARDLVRFGRLLWSVKSDEAKGYLGSPFSRTLGNRYDERPASHYFSPEFCGRILRPMSVRMNGAEPDEVYVGNLTSNVRMLLDTYEQFTDGIAPVLRGFLSRYAVRLNTATEGILVSGGRATGVRVRCPDGRVAALHGAGVIVATPAHVAATFTETMLPNLSRRLRSIAYYPVSLIVAEYDRPIFSPSQRAFVFDSDTPVSNAGAYGVNDLHLVRYTFSGRASRRHISDAADDEALLAIAEGALAKYVTVPRGSRLRFAAKRFSPGLCAYAPHHARLIDDVHEELKKVTGLHLTGDYMQGASIEACFRSASACVRQLTN